MNTQTNMIEKININVSCSSMLNSINTPTEELLMAHNRATRYNAARALRSSSDVSTLSAVSANDTNDNLTDITNDNDNDNDNESDETDYHRQQKPEYIIPCYNPTQSMLFKGYIPSNKPLAKTLQGSIWRGKMGNYFNRNVVIKVTNKQLHETKSTFLDGQKVGIEENIISEMRILHYLTTSGAAYHGLTQHMTNFIDFFHDQSSYFLVMEDGGSSIFDFCTKAHKFITLGSVSIYEWQTICKHIFYQMVTFIDHLHKMNVCHLDVSLENILISDVMMINDANHQIHFIPKFTVKFCDFGLAEYFPQNDAKSNEPNFICSKFVGKTNYKAPEIYTRKNSFDARAADVWSLGVCLFAIIFGSMPFFKPSASDECFQWIMAGHLLKLIEQWNKTQYINQYQYDILYHIFQPQQKRINTKQILSHPWFHQKSVQ